MLSLIQTVKEKEEEKRYICPVGYNPNKKDQHSIHGIKKKFLKVHFIAGRHIFGLGRTYQSVNTSNVDYSIEIIGVDADKAKYRFKVRSPGVVKRYRTGPSIRYRQWSFLLFLQMPDMSVHIRPRSSKIKKARKTN